MDAYAKSIVVIHPDGEHVRQIGEGLARHGCRIEHFTSAREAYAHMVRDSLRPRMIVVEWAVPDRERFPLVDQLAVNPRLASVPVLVLVDPNQTRAVATHGVRAVLSIPVRPRMVAELVATLCGFTTSGELDTGSPNARTQPPAPWDKNGRPGSGNGSRR